MSRKLAILANMMVLGILLLSVVLTTPTPAMAGVNGKPATATPGGGGPTPTPIPGTPISIYGAWHCGNHYCDWSIVRNTAAGGEFDVANHWLIDRGDGSGKPSVNMVILSFVNPLKLLNKTTDAGDVNGVPIGMDANVINYFKSHNIRVMLSIGGVTYTNDWDTALGTDAITSTTAIQLGANAAAVAQQYGVGIEIDYERGTGPKMQALQAFVNTYRAQLPYDASGNNPAARLTIDVATGDRYLIELNRYATTYWLKTSDTGIAPVLDYSNAMVSGGPTNWQEHIDGKPNYAPPVPPLAPAKFTGGLNLTGGSAECNNFSSSSQNADANYVQTVQPNGAGVTAGMLGFMFWAAECPSTRGTCTTPPNTCEGGMGVAAKTFNISIPMTALRQQ